MAPQLTNENKHFLSTSDLKKKPPDANNVQNEPLTQLPSSKNDDKPAQSFINDNAFSANALPNDFTNSAVSLNTNQPEYTFKPITPTELSMDEQSSHNQPTDTNSSIDFWNEDNNVQNSEKSKSPTENIKNENNENNIIQNKIDSEKLFENVQSDTQKDSEKSYDLSISTSSDNYFSNDNSIQEIQGNTDLSTSYTSEDFEASEPYPEEPKDPVDDSTDAASLDYWAKYNATWDTKIKIKAVKYSSNSSLLDFWESENVSDTKGNMVGEAETETTTEGNKTEANTEVNKTETTTEINVTETGTENETKSGTEVNKIDNSSLGNHELDKMDATKIHVDTEQHKEENAERVHSDIKNVTAKENSDSELKPEQISENTDQELDLDRSFSPIIQLFEKQNENLKKLNPELFSEITKVIESRKKSPNKSIRKVPSLQVIATTALRKFQNRTDKLETNKKEDKLSVSVSVSVNEQIQPQQKKEANNTDNLGTEDMSVSDNTKNSGTVIFQEEKITEVIDDQNKESESSIIVPNSNSAETDGFNDIQKNNIPIVVHHDQIKTENQTESAISNNMAAPLNIEEKNESPVLENDKLTSEADKPVKEIEGHIENSVHENEEPIIDNKDVNISENENNSTKNQDESTNLLNNNEKKDDISYDIQVTDLESSESNATQKSIHADEEQYQHENNKNITTEDTNTPSINSNIDNCDHTLTDESNTEKTVDVADVNETTTVERKDDKNVEMTNSQNTVKEENNLSESILQPEEANNKANLSEESLHLVQNTEKSTEISSNDIGNEKEIDKEILISTVKTTINNKSDDNLSTELTENKPLSVTEDSMGASPLPDDKIKIERNISEKSLLIESAQDMKENEENNEIVNNTVINKSEITSLQVIEAEEQNHEKVNSIAINTPDIIESVVSESINKTTETEKVKSDLSPAIDVLQKVDLQDKTTENDIENKENETKEKTKLNDTTLETEKNIQVQSAEHEIVPNNTPTNEVGDVEIKMDNNAKADTLKEAFTENHNKENSSSNENNVKEKVVALKNESNDKEKMNDTASDVKLNSENLTTPVKKKRKIVKKSSTAVSNSTDSLKKATVRSSLSPEKTPKNKAESEKSENKPTGVINTNSVLKESNTNTKLTTKSNSLLKDEKTDEDSIKKEKDEVDTENVTNKENSLPPEATNLSKNQSKSKENLSSKAQKVKTEPSTEKSENKKETNTDKSVQNKSIKPKETLVQKMARQLSNRENESPVTKNAVRRKSSIEINYKIEKFQQNSSLPLEKKENERIKDKENNSNQNLKEKTIVNKNKEDNKPIKKIGDDKSKAPNSLKTNKSVGTVSKTPILIKSDDKKQASPVKKGNVVKTVNKTDKENKNLKSDASVKENTTKPSIRTNIKQTEKPQEKTSELKKVNLVKNTTTKAQNTVATQENKQMLQIKPPETAKGKEKIQHKILPSNNPTLKISPKSRIPIIQKKRINSTETKNSNSVSRIPIKAPSQQTTIKSNIAPDVSEENKKVSEMRLSSSDHTDDWVTSEEEIYSDESEYSDYSGSPEPDIADVLNESMNVLKELSKHYAEKRLAMDKDIPLPQYDKTSGEFASGEESNSSISESNIDELLSHSAEEESNYDEFDELEEDEYESDCENQIGGPSYSEKLVPDLTVVINENSNSDKVKINTKREDFSKKQSFIEDTCDSDEYVTDDENNKELQDRKSVV